MFKKKIKIQVFDNQSGDFGNATFIHMHQVLSGVASCV